MLEAIVKEAISELADFVRCYNSAFLYLIAEKRGTEAVNQAKSLRAKTESTKQRISDLDKLFSRIYEDNILGKLSDERYSRMASEYEAEQKHLISEVEANEKVLIELQKQTVDMKMLYQGLMEFTEMKQLTPTVVNKLIERIEINNNEKKHSHNNVKVDIYFTAVGLFDIPTEQELLETTKRVEQKKSGDIRLNKGKGVTHIRDYALIPKILPYYTVANAAPILLTKFPFDIENIICSL